MRRSTVVFSFDEFEFDESLYELRRGGTTIKAEAQVLELLAYLLRNPRRVVTKEELIREVWHGCALGDNVISVCVAKLRKLLGGSDNRCISSAYGRGYRFLREVQVSASLPPPSPVPAPRRVLGAPFVGRQVAMNRLDAALEHARAGRGVMCALLGEAGIGKTRAAEVLEEQANAAGFLVSWGRCHAFEDVPPLWPWLQVVRPCQDRLPEELRAPLSAAAVRSDRDADRGEPRDVPWEFGAPEDWSRTLGWMSSVVRAITATQPWLIVLEDLQWADAASIQLLAHLAPEVAQQPVLILLTVRDAQLPRDPRARRGLDYVLGHRDCERIELVRLQAEDVATYTNQIFGGADGALSDAIFARSEGNPFFMVELLRPFVHGPAPQASALALSGAALDIVRQTLQGFDPAARELLAAAAVIGRGFDLGLLSEVTRSPAESLLSTLEDAMISHVIVASRESHTEFAFGHDLIRSVLYDDLSSSARLRLHQRVAEALSARKASGSAELAHHLLSALPSGDVATAVQTAQRAAMEASQVGAFADACAILRRALAALRLRPGADPRTECGLLFGLSSCERASGEPNHVAHFQEALALARQQRFGSALSWAGQSMSSSPGIITVPGAASVLEAALESLPAEAVSTRAVVLTHLAWTPPHCSDQARVDRLLSEAEQLAENQGRRVRRNLLRAKLYYAGGPGDHARMLEVASEMESMVPTHGGRQRARWSLELSLSRIVAMLQRGDLSRAQQMADAFGAAARELGNAELIWHYDRMCVVMRMNAGDFVFANTGLVELKQRADRLQLQGYRAVEAVDWGELLSQTADLAPLAGKLSSQLEPNAQDPPGVRAYKLRAMVRFQLLEEARTALRATPIDSLPRVPRSRDYLAAMAHMAFAAVATRETEYARALYDALAPYPQYCIASLSCHCYGSVSHSLGALARVLDERERAVAHFDTAIQDQERLGLRPQLARSRFELATLLAESSDAAERTRARSLLEQVRSTAKQLTMQPLLAASEKLLASIPTA